jgi:hypothetical protein
MKTTYRYIKFNLGDSGIWWCRPRRGDPLEFLGTVEVFERWHQYCFFPREDTVYSSECLDDIADFLRQLNKGDVPKEDR